MRSSAGTSGAAHAREGGLSSASARQGKALKDMTRVRVIGPLDPGRKQGRSSAAPSGPLLTHKICVEAASSIAMAAVEALELPDGGSSKVQAGRALSTVLLSPNIFFNVLCKDIAHFEGRGAFVRYTMPPCLHNLA